MYGSSFETSEGELIMTRLENWTLMTRTDLYGNSYQQLAGKVYNHPMANHETSELCDGHNVITSKIVEIDLVNNVAVTQSGTVYKLGFIKNKVKEV